MKIKKVTIEKFRAIKKSEIELSTETALVGQNSAGKSSILRALNAFFNFEQESSAFEEGRHVYMKTTVSIISVVLSEVPNECELPRVANGGNEIACRLKYRKTANWQIFENGSWVSAPNDLHNQLSRHIHYAYIPMRRDHEISGWGETGLLQSAVNAWVKHHTQRRDTISPKVSELSARIQTQVFKGLGKHIRSVMPMNGKFSISLEYQSEPDYTLLLKDLVLRVSEGATTVDLEDCGSGTQSMTAFGLYSYLAELQGSTYVLGIEEPEQNLHPHAQRELLQNLRSLPLQVLFTTHSTVMIDALSHEEVILCRRVPSTARGVEVVTTQLPSRFWEENGFDRDRYYQFYKQKNSDFFFAKYIVLVESPVDGEIIKYLLLQEGIDTSVFSVSVLSVDGVKSLPYAYNLMKELSVDFSVVVDKDYFLPYLHDSRNDSLDGSGFPKYRREFRGGTLLEKMLPNERDRTNLLERFHSNHSRAMDVLERSDIFCFRWAIEVDLVASTNARNLICDEMNIAPQIRSKREVLKRKNKLKKLEVLLPVLDQLPKRNYPHSYARIRNKLSEKIKSATSWSD